MSALTAVNLLVFAVVLALPVLAIPALLRGSVDRDLLETARRRARRLRRRVRARRAAALAPTGPLALGRAARSSASATGCGARPSRCTTCPSGCCTSATGSCETLGPRWKRALVATVGRWTFDYLTLLGRARRDRLHTRVPGWCCWRSAAAQVLAQIPVTPGGLGFVEAGLTAMLALAGVSAGDAVLATFAYRLFTYWLPLPLGLVAFAMHRAAAARG